MGVIYLGLSGMGTNLTLLYYEAFCLLEYNTVKYVENKAFYRCMSPLISSNYSYMVCFPRR
jgi:hypothetical protein